MEMLTGLLGNEAVLNLVVAAAAVAWALFKRSEWAQEKLKTWWGAMAEAAASAALQVYHEQVRPWKVANPDQKVPDALAAQWRRQAGELLKANAEDRGLDASQLSDSIIETLVQKAVNRLKGGLD